MLKGEISIYKTINVYRSIPNFDFWKVLATGLASYNEVTIELRHASCHSFCQGLTVLLVSTFASLDPHSKEPCSEYSSCRAKRRRKKTIRDKCFQLDYLSILSLATLYFLWTTTFSGVSVTKTFPHLHQTKSETPICHCIALWRSNLDKRHSYSPSIEQ